MLLIEYINLDKSDRIKMLEMLRLHGFKVFRNNQDFISIHRTVYKKFIKKTIIYPKWY